MRLREYSVLFYRPGGYMNWSTSRIFRSRARIRTVTILLFRRWFGREPSLVWHKDGFMAEARDNRGNEIQVEQVNGKWALIPFRPEAPKMPQDDLRGISIPPAPVQRVCRELHPLSIQSEKAGHPQGNAQNSEGRAA